MADRALFMAWTEPVRGAEEHALGVFNEAMGLLGRKQQEGKIESFDVVLLDPNSELDGYITIKGSAEQIAELRSDPEFQSNTVQAQLAVNGIRHITGYTNEGVATQMGIYQEAISQVPQRA